MADKETERRHRTGRRAMTEQERLMRERLEKFPLSSAADIAGLCRDDYGHSNRTLKSLEEKHLAEGMDLGYSLRKQRRYWVVTKSANSVANPPLAKHSGLVHALMKRVTLTESVYLVINNALAANPKRRLRDFQWHFDAAVDATARFNDGWMAFKWSGIWQDYHSQIRNMEHLHRNLRAWKPGERPPLPGRICFIVPDDWQAELVRRVVSMSGQKERYLIYNAMSGQIEGDYDLSRSRGRPPKLDMQRWRRHPDRLDTLMRRVLTFEDSKALIRVLMTIEQWPGIPRSALKHITKLNGKSLTTSLRISIELGLVWQVAHGGYAPDHPWLSIAASRDRVWSGKPTGAFSRDKVAEYYAGRIGPHELGAVKLAGWFAAAGCPVAPGWRFRDVMGKHGQVAPDGMIYLRQSPFGATWFYLEYELRAQGTSDARKKFRAYRSPRRSDDFPVLVVCRRKEVPNFLRESAGMRVLVAPVNDVRQGNVIGDSGTVWLHDGHPVSRLGP